MDTIIVAVQGGAASYHEQAARLHFGRRYQPLYCQTFAQVFAALQAGTAQRAVVAVHNTIYGDIAEPLRLLQQAGESVRQVARVTLPIHHCLIGLPGTRLEAIREVRSQDVALAQCRHFLRQELPHAKLVYEPDTAGSVARIALLKDPAVAAVASSAAAKLYGMDILHENVEDDPSNATTFVVLEPQQILGRSAGQAVPARSARPTAASGPHVPRL